MVAHYNKEKQVIGISCDFCGNTKVEKFTYYSAKLDKVQVDKVVGFQTDRDVDRRHLDLDICEACFGAMREKILKVIKNRDKNKNKWSSSAKVEHKQ